MLTDEELLENSKCLFVRCGGQLLKALISKWVVVVGHHMTAQRLQKSYKMSIISKAVSLAWKDFRPRNCRSRERKKRVTCHPIRIIKATFNTVTTTMALETSRLLSIPMPIRLAQ
jgi:hypothetical protein